MLELDHLIITAPNLEVGTTWAEARLGLPLQPGGAHDMMGTHNRLLSLGADFYLEVIAIDPTAQPVDRPRWYAMDDQRPTPALTHWACRAQDLNAALAAAPPGHGHPTAITRGDLAWTMALTDRLPFDDAYPALLSWQSPLPAPRLADQGARLASLRVSHPQAAVLQHLLAPQLSDPRVTFESGAPSLRAEIETPTGLRVL